MTKLNGEKPANYKELIIQQKKLFFNNYDQQLDFKPYGEYHLSNPKVAAIVKDKLLEFDKDLYSLLAYCIMPNHVHVLIDFSVQVFAEDGFMKKNVEENYKQLFQVMKRIKGGSAVVANRI